ncbi:MAG: hypothetical protein ACRDK1_07810 [Solirubrobacterales bacterium]
MPATVSAAGTKQFRLFSPNSVWNHPLAPNARIDPRSPQMVAGLLQEVRREQTAGVGPWIQTDSYSTPLYIAGPHQRLVRVALDDPTASWRVGLQKAFNKVPIPSYARPAAGSDAHMTVWQPSTDRLWEFWRARKQNGVWHASWGGAMNHTSQSPGYYTNNSWPGLSAPNWGATATSLPVIAGTMLLRDLRSPWIRHALAVDLPSPAAGHYSWPAQRTDGSGPVNSIPEGARLRLPPNLDLVDMNLPPIVLKMARAVKRRGMIVRDQTGSAIGFFAQDPVRARQDPYYGAGGLFGGQWPNKFLARFPWDKLEVMKLSLCSDQSRPCLKH